MKKILAILALTASASALAGPTIALSYDNDYGSETKLSLAQETRFGTFDAGLLATRYTKLTAPGMDNANGFDLGYSYGVAFNRVGIVARGAFGRLNDIDENGGGFTGSSNYVSIGAEASMPIASNINVFVGVRHRNTLSDGPTQNRGQAGVDVAISKSIGARVGVSHARQAGRSGTGVAANLSYTF